MMRCHRARAYIGGVIVPGVAGVAGVSGACDTIVRGRAFVRGHTSARAYIGGAYIGGARARAFFGGA